MIQQVSHPAVKYILLALFALAFGTQLISVAFPNPVTPLVALFGLGAGLLYFIRRSKIFTEGTWVFVSDDEKIHVSKNLEGSVHGDKRT